VVDHRLTEEEHVTVKVDASEPVAI